MMRNWPLRGCVLILLVSGACLAEDDLKPLNDSEGYALLAVDVLNSSFSALSLDGGFTLGDVYTLKSDEMEKGVNFRLIKLRAGTYHWSRMLLGSSMNADWHSQTWHDLDEFKYTIEVLPGRVSYGGHLFIDTDFSYGTFSYKNRVSQAIKYLEECCQTVLDDYPFEYAGPGVDPYPDYYFSLIQGREKE